MHPRFLIQVSADQSSRENHKEFREIELEKMGSAEPNLDQIFEQNKRKRNPLVPIGALMTAGVLTAGLISFKTGNSQLGQLLMRARVVVQGATVALMVGTAYYYGENPWQKPS